MSSIHKLLQILQLSDDAGLNYRIKYIYRRCNYDTNELYVDEDDAFLTVEYEGASLDFHIDGTIIACGFYGKEPKIWIVDDYQKSLEEIKKIIIYNKVKKNSNIFPPNETKSLWQKLLNKIKNV